MTDQHSPPRSIFHENNQDFPSQFEANSSPEMASFPATPTKAPQDAIKMP